MHAHPAADRQRRREADPVEPVVDGEGEALEREDLLAEGGRERQRVVAVGDRAAERRLARALRVDVDPLVVAGDVGERVDVVLGDLVPVGGAEVLALRLLELVESGDRAHGGGPYPARAMPRPLLLTDAPHLLYRAFFALPDTITDADGAARSTRCWARSTRRCGASTAATRARSSAASAQEAADYRTEAYPRLSRAPPADAGRRWPTSGSARRRSTRRSAGPSSTSPRPRGRRPACTRYAAAEAAARRAGADPHRRPRHVPVRDRQRRRAARSARARRARTRWGRRRSRRATAIAPALVPDFIALRGDPSDGLPGAKGIGEKTARRPAAPPRLARGGDRRRRCARSRPCAARCSSRPTSCARSRTSRRCATAEVERPPDRADRPRGRRGRGRARAGHEAARRAARRRRLRRELDGDHVAVGHRVVAALEPQRRRGRAPPRSRRRRPAPASRSPRRARSRAGCPSGSRPRRARRVSPRRRCQLCAGLSSPAVKKASRSSSPKAPRTTRSSPVSPTPSSSRMAAASSSSSSDELGLEPRRHRDRGGADGGGVVGHDGGHRVVAFVDVGHVEHRLAGQRREVAQRVGRGRRARARCAPARRAGAPRSPRAATPPRRPPRGRRRAPRAPRARGAARPARGRRRSAPSRSSPCPRPGRRGPRGGSRSRRGARARRAAARRSRARWPGTGCRAPRPCARRPRARRCRGSRSCPGRRSGADGGRDGVEPRIAHRHDGDVRLDRRERVVRRLRSGARERVEERRLARVGQPDDPDLHRPRLPTTVPSAAPAATSDG